ncbi:DNA fragmentation factor subunit alpha [Rhinophrynus dorsalis]
MDANAKICLVTLRGGLGRHSLMATSLQDLLEKACKKFALDSEDHITIVLEEDGTIVDDEDYFLCLPSSTKFVVLTGNKKWSPTTIDGGTAWLAQESVEVDDVDGPRWKKLTVQLKENLSNIILLSESDLQTLIEAPVEELAKEVGLHAEKVEVLQDTLQRVLDSKEEERESRQLLELYLKAAKQEGNTESREQDGGATGLVLESVALDDVDNIDVQSWKHLTVQLKENLSNIILMSESDLQTIIKVPVEELAREFGVSFKKVPVLQETLKRMLNLKTEERQSNQVMEDFLEVMKREGNIEPGTKEPSSIDEVDHSGRNSQGEQSCITLLSSKSIKTLKEKELPHLSLSREELEASSTFLY